MTDEILSDRNLEYFIADWKMIPAAGGLFEIEVNGELIFSKKFIHKRHAEPGEIKAMIKAMVDAFKQEKGLNWDDLPQED